MKTSRPAWMPRLVAIVGGSGSGKSWLAAQLSNCFGKKSACLCLDDFYRDRPYLTLLQRTRINFDHPRSIDWKRFERALRECKTRSLLVIPRYDFKTHARLATAESWKPKPMVFVEGLWLLRRPRVRRIFDFRLFLECPTSVRLQRRIDRDTLQRGRNRGDVAEQFHRQVEPMHARFVANQARWADLVIRSPIGTRDLDFLSLRLRELLQQRTPLRKVKMSRDRAQIEDCIHD